MMRRSGCGQVLIPVGLLSILLVAGCNNPSGAPVPDDAVAPSPGELRAEMAIEQAREPAPTGTAATQSLVPAPLSERELRRFRARGLSDPVHDLKQDLMARPELIPVEGVLGGTMRIFGEEDIAILNSRWAMASFEDGHIRGHMLLEYTVDDGGQITWRVLTSMTD